MRRVCWSMLETKRRVVNETVRRICVTQIDCCFAFLVGDARVVFIAVRRVLSVQHGIETFSSHLHEVRLVEAPLSVKQHQITHFLDIPARGSTVRGCSAPCRRWSGTAGRRCDLSVPTHRARRRTWRTAGSWSTSRPARAPRPQRYTEHLPEGGGRGGGYGTWLRYLGSTEIVLHYKSLPVILLHSRRWFPSDPFPIKTQS